MPDGRASGIYALAGAPRRQRKPASAVGRIRAVKT